jgi:hypothetical protein
MTKSDWLTAPALALAAVLMLPLMAAASPDLVDVCHLTSDSAPDGHEWRHIRVNPKSLDKHLEHGDVEVGNTISGTTRYLDHECNIQDTDPQSPPRPSEPPTPSPAPETVFAIAYSVDPDDGTEILIAKLIDGPDEASDGVPGPGDLIIPGHYPVDFDLLGEPALFSPVIHTVDALTLSPGYVCWVQSGSNNFVWSTGDGDFDQYQEWGSDGSVTSLYDARSSGSSGTDVITVDTGSPSSPSTDVGPLSRFDILDQTFIEVEAGCP